MTKQVDIKAFHVSVVDVTQGVERELAARDFRDGPGEHDAALLDVKYGALEWDRVKIRQKTCEGDVFVTFRYQDANNAVQTSYKDLRADGEVRVEKPGGPQMLIRIRALPASEWKVGAAMKFDAPRARIVGIDGGWSIIFEPQQFPCVATVAVEAKGSKDEHLPSFPFPSNPKFKSGTYFLPANKFLAKVDGIVRLGVRGTGLTVNVRLPRPGQTVEVDPKLFELKGHAQPELLTENYVVTKYNEKYNQIAYGY